VFHLSYCERYAEQQPITSGVGKIVNRMVKLAAPQITPGEALQIIYFLSTEYGPRKGNPARRPDSTAR
jgi:hypothetical protein